MSLQALPNMDLVERWAIKLALGNNGGTWAEHYNDEQKCVWRRRAIEFISDCIIELEKSRAPS